MIEYSFSLLVGFARKGSIQGALYAFVLAFKKLFLRFFFLSSTLILFCSFAQAMEKTPELEQARQFLCQFDICVTKDFNVKYKTNMEHRGYFKVESAEIWIDDSLTSVNKKLMFVHELVHAFRQTHTSQEARWLEEGLAKFWEYKYASDLWPVSYNLRFKKNPMFFLSDDEKFYGREGDGYISSFFLVFYLYRHYGGMELINKMMRSKLSGWNNIIHAIQDIRNESLTPVPPELTTPLAILKHLSVALWANDPYEAKYGLFYMDQNFESPLEAIQPLFSDWNKIFSLPKSTSSNKPSSNTKSTLSTDFSLNAYISYYPSKQRASYFAHINKTKNNSALFLLLDYNPITAEFYDPTMKSFEFNRSFQAKTIIEIFVN